MTELGDGASLALKSDFDSVQKRWLAFWQHEIIDRPCCLVRAPKAEAIRRQPPPYLAGAKGDLRSVALQVVAWAESIYWGGEAVPYYSPSFGPDMMAAFLGAPLVFPEEKVGTNWAQACIDDWEKALLLRLDPDNYWWRRMQEFCRILGEECQGKLIVAHLDLHSNMDTLLAMRGAEGLCLDLIDVPELIDQAMVQVRALYAPLYECLYEWAGMASSGTCGWVPAYHPTRTNTIQCDFAALIGSEHFRRWALPALVEEASFLGECVYHLDGPDCLVHLDDLCAIEGIKCIQWVQGAGRKPFVEWMDLLKYIQSRGVSVWVPCNINDIKLYHAELRPDLVCYDCWAPDEASGKGILAWLQENT
jgi:hypothetical protein